MGVSASTVEMLRDLGHDAVHLRDEGLQKLADAEIVSKALKEQRTVLTFDLDFGSILAASQSTQPSVVIFRLRNQTPVSVNRRLTQVITECESKLAAGAVVVVEDLGYRVRTLPIAAIGS